MNQKKIPTTSPLRRKRNTIVISDGKLVHMHEIFPQELDYCLEWLKEHCALYDLGDLTSQHVLLLQRHLCDELFVNHYDFRTVLDLNVHIIMLNEICIAAGIGFVLELVPFPSTENGGVADG